MEIRDSRAEGDVQVYEVILTINTSALTIDQVLSKRRKMLLDMGDSMEGEVLHDLLNRGELHFDGEERPLKCEESGTSPIRGVLYKSKHSLSHLCESEYQKLPEGFGEAEAPRKGDYWIVEPWCHIPHEAIARASVAKAIVLGMGL